MSSGTAQPLLDDVRYLETQTAVANSGVQRSSPSKGGAEIQTFQDKAKQRAI